MNVIIIEKRSEKCYLWAIKCGLVIIDNGFEGNSFDALNRAEYQARNLEINIQKYDLENE